MSGTWRTAWLVHVVSLGLWAGGGVFFSFWVAPRVFVVLRDQVPLSPPPGVSGWTRDVGRRLAGDTVGAMFRGYFAYQVVLGVLGVGAGAVVARRAARVDAVRAILTAAALTIVVIHAVTVYPASVRTRAQQYAAQAAGESSGADALGRRFGMLHGVSQLMNMAALVLAVAALVLVGVRVPARAD